MKFLLRTICLIVLLLTVIPLVGFYTERGSSAVLNAAELLLPLEIEYGSGSLSGRLTLHRLEYTTESMRLQLDNALVRLD